METIAEVLGRRAAETPDAQFVQCGGDWITCAQLDRATRAVATGLLDLGLARGDRVASLLAPRREAIELYLGAVRAGLVFVPFNPFLKGEFLRHQLHDSGARAVVTDESGIGSLRAVGLEESDVDHVVLTDDGTTIPCVKATTWSSVCNTTEPAADIDLGPGDLAMIVYTSGTTGLSKGCMLSQAYLASLASPYQLRGWVAPGERVITPFGFAHVSGPMALSLALHTEGSSICFEPGFSASTFMARAAEENATSTFGLGTMARAVLACPPKPSDSNHSLRSAIWIGLDAEGQLDWEGRFHVAVHSEGIGQTECAAMTLGGTRKRGSLGHPCEHVEVRVVDEDDVEVPDGVPGEIVIRPRIPHTIYSGYWRNPEATLTAWRNLWHHTGDLALRDEDGCLHFVDRKKDMIRRRGENISSFELEAAIGRHPRVAGVVAVAVPASLGDDDVKVNVIPAGNDPIDLAGLFDFFMQNLPYYAIPRYIEFHESFPVTPATGRVQKATLREAGITAATYDLEALGFGIGRAERRNCQGRP